MSARRRLIVSVAVGLLAGGVAGALAAWQISVLIGWCATAVTFVVFAWSTILSAGSEQTRALAEREDDSRVVADLVVLAACVASLVGVAFVLLKASSADGAALVGMTLLGILSVLLAWGVVHTVFTLRYADLYYRNDDGGIEFNGDEPPDYRDFAYLAFTVGMTYQVSDTNLQTKEMRRTGLKHSLLSYLFGTVIIAVMINIVAGIAR
jgi:uncharacterized membrane protein